MYYGLTLFILDTGKQVRWQTEVPDKMPLEAAFHLFLHCNADKNNLLGQKYIIL